MLMKKQKRLFNFFLVLGLALLAFGKTVTKYSNSTKRVRYTFLGKTFVIVDTNGLNNDTIIHVFDYSTELAHQFINGAYNGALDLWSVK